MEESPVTVLLWIADLGLLGWQLPLLAGRSWMQSQPRTCRSEYPRAAIGWCSGIRAVGQ